MPTQHDFTNFATEHPNYFPGQFLLEDDFELQHKYLGDRQKYHNQSLQVSGILEGLEVTPVQDKKEVEVAAGTAIDSQGNLIVLKDKTTFSNWGDLTTGTLFIQFTQEKTNKQQEEIAESFTRWTERAAIGVAGIGAIPSGAIALCSFDIIGDDEVRIDSSVCEYSGVYLPNATNQNLSLRSGGITNPNLAILSGSLKVMGDAEFVVGGMATWNKLVVTTSNAWGSDPSHNHVTLGAGGAGGIMLSNPHVSWRDNKASIRYGLSGGVPTGAYWDVGIRTNNAFSFALNGVNDHKLWIAGDGNVAIGTTDPGDYKLRVAGKLSANDILTEQNLTLNGLNSDLSFARTKESKILWNSNANFGSDKAFIYFKENSNLVGSSAEDVRLSIGVFNDFGQTTTHGDALDIQGGAQLTLNAGIWDAELNTAIGTPVTGKGLKGISFRVNNTEQMSINDAGNVKLNNNLEVGNNLTLNGAKQIIFKNDNTSNNLKLQLWGGYGLGINSGTLFYAANGNHSWRDENGTNERMKLTTAATGGLAVYGTGESSFAGNLAVGGEINGQLRSRSIQFKVEGDATKFYPIVFQDDGWINGECTLEIVRPNVHTDSQWHGSLLSKFVWHSTNWGHGSDFLHMEFSQNRQYFIADYKVIYRKPKIAIWLRGGSTYWYRSSHPTSLLDLDAKAKTIDTEELSIKEEADIKLELKNWSAYILGKKIAGSQDIDGKLRFNSSNNRSIYGEARGVNNSRETIVMSGHWDELEVRGRVIDWTGSNLHIGHEVDHSNDSIYIGNGKLKSVEIQGKTPLKIADKWATTSAENSLTMLRGLINPDGSIYSGSGFTSRRISTGLYEITFSESFSDYPAVITTQDYPGNTNSEGGNTKDNAVVVGIAQNKCRIKCGDGDGSPANRYFCFLAIGLR